MRKFLLTLAAVVLGLISTGTDSSLAQGERIDKVSNRRLAGSSFVNLRGLSYQECERRCMAEQRCKALEHIRGGAARGSTSQCRLFSAFGAAHAAQELRHRLQAVDAGQQQGACGQGSAEDGLEAAAGAIQARANRGSAPPPHVPSSPAPPASEPKAKSAMKKAAPPPPPAEESARRWAGAPVSGGGEEAEHGPTARSATRSAPPPPVPAPNPGSPARGIGATPPPPRARRRCQPPPNGMWFRCSSARIAAAAISPSASATAPTAGASSRSDGR